MVEPRFSIPNVASSSLVLRSDFKHAHLAQLVEQRICNAQVVSSNLTMGSKEE